MNETCFLIDFPLLHINKKFSRKERSSLRLNKRPQRSQRACHAISSAKRRSAFLRNGTTNKQRPPPQSCCHAKRHRKLRSSLHPLYFNAVKYSIVLLSFQGAFFQAPRRPPAAKEPEKARIALLQRACQGPAGGRGGHPPQGDKKFFDTTTEKGYTTHENFGILKGSEPAPKIDRRL